ncbi:hypothetical protein G7085_04940 [Tessaracoccus sp. HDW20]|uniref:hypothetical protein n=1 Tax=Tessaracoccus coleopterorum TaxID=2714950 RepID=UPI0018D4B814|nr:hypothetical protein [Tessaracoccus coleopterorum]NHB84189.1 hypothetical protein [Tessaracoccus coleopterorum]
MRVWLADSNLAGAYAAARDGSPLPDGVFDVTTPVPVVLGGSSTTGTGRGTLAGVGEVTVSGHLDVLPASPGTRPGCWSAPTTGRAISRPPRPRWSPPAPAPTSRP